MSTRLTTHYNKLRIYILNTLPLVLQLPAASSNMSNSPTDDAAASTAKKMKPTPAVGDDADDGNTSTPVVQPPPQQCQHFVQRKKRLCKMSVARGRSYCGEHLPQATGGDALLASAHENSYIVDDHKKSKRVPCPLDPKHTVYAWNLAKHVRICNARPPERPAAFIQPGINAGDANEDAADDDDEQSANIRLSELPAAVLEPLLATIDRLFVEHRLGDVVTAAHHQHASMAAELERVHYGPATLRHLRQTSALLGHLEHAALLRQPATSFIEFGAGKGHLSYWLAQTIGSVPGSNVLLVDRASHRHKQDNKVAERDVTVRIRADIADLRLAGVEECDGAERLVGVGKHLCGAATDLAVRCMLQQPERLGGCVVALCCHHRCAWRPFVGKRWFERNGLGRREFAVMTRLVSWAVCGTGMSRETRRAMAEREHDEPAEEVYKEAAEEAKEELPTKLDGERRAEIGRRCKRLIDHARVEFLREQCPELEVSLHYYVPADVTLENVVYVARKRRAVAATETTTTKTE